jgi:hypothetical protein
MRPGRAPDYRDRDYAVRRPKPTRYEVLKDAIGRWMSDRLRVAEMLKEIRDGKLYKKEYPTFEAFCAKEYGISQTHAYRLL